MVTVYIVIATDPRGKTTELAKFFEPRHALEFSQGLGNGWKLVGTVKRDETDEEQHPAHRLRAFRDPAFSSPPKS